MPPRLRPNPSVSGPPLLHQRNADALEPMCYPRNGGSNRYCQLRRPAVAAPPIFAAECRPHATGKNDWPRFAKIRTARADPAREPQCARSTACRSARVGDPSQVDPSSASVAAIGPPDDSTARPSSLLGALSLKYTSGITLCRHALVPHLHEDGWLRWHDFAANEGFRDRAHPSATLTILCGTILES